MTEQGQRPQDIAELPMTEADFAAAMAAVVTEPTNSATPGDRPDILPDDPATLASEGGGDDPDACHDHLEDN